MGHLSILTSLLSNFTIFNKKQMFFGKVKYINTPAEFELVTFRLEVRHNMKMSQTTFSCEWVFINTMLWDLDSL